MPPTRLQRRRRADRAVASYDAQLTPPPAPPPPPLPPCSSQDAGTPFPAPYKLAWTAIALEVTSLLVALYAIVVGPYRNWRATVLAMLATVTAILVGLTNE